MEKQDLKKYLAEYVKAARDYKTRKSLFWDERNEQEERILGAFALPVTHTHYVMMFDAATGKGSIESTAEQMTEMLQHTAEAYFTAPTKSDLKLLKEAREQKEMDQEILPLLGFKWGGYNSFVYNEFFIRGHCDERQLLAALQQSKGKTIPTIYKYIKTKKAFTQLQQNTALPYLSEYREYIRYERSHPVWNGRHRNKKRSLYHLPQAIKLNHFYITFIRGRVDHVWVGLLTEYEDAFVELSVITTYKELYRLLDGARYYSYAGEITKMTHYYLEKLSEIEEYVIRCKKELGKRIEILNTDLEITPYSGPLSKQLRGINYMSKGFYI